MQPCPAAPGSCAGCSHVKDVVTTIPATGDGDTRWRRPAATALTVSVVAWLAVAAALRHHHGAVGLGNPITSGGADAAVTALAVMRAVVGLVAVAVVRGRVRHGVDEREVWQPLSLTAVLVTVGLVAEAVTAALEWQAGLAPHAWYGLFTGVPSLAALVCVYPGMVEWNRFGTQLSDPSDRLNGIASVFALVSIANLAVHDTVLATWPWWELQLWLLIISTLFILLGTAATVAVLGALTRELRLWLLAGGLALVELCQIASGIVSGHHGGDAASQLGWVELLVALAWCALRRPAPIEARPATARSTTGGALVVLLASAGVMVVDSQFFRSDVRAVSIYAGLAFLFASTHMVRIMRDLAQLAATRIEARSDDLTGIANRRELVERLASRRHAGQPSLLMVIDLDRFKEVNDRFGHAVGDELLRQLTLRLHRQLPRHSVFARLGGDEFAVLVDDQPMADAVELAHRLVASLSDETLVQEQAVSVGASVGIAATGAGDDATATTSGELLRRADVAMYVAKRAGGGVSVFDPALDGEQRERTELAAELRAMLAPPVSRQLLTQLEVHYQPQLDIATGAVTGVEALVRWRHPRLGLLPPGEFLELVEAYSLMEPLTEHVLTTAASQATAWFVGGHRLRVAVNLSPSCLINGRLLPMVDRVLAGFAQGPGDLTLEITETSLMRNATMALQVCRDLAARGIAVSIDDFGTGYSSLSYLDQLPAVELKVDRAFTMRLLDDARTAVIVGGIVELAHRLGLRVVAEGVEDLPTLDALRELGCDEVQGYLVARPMPAADLTVWLNGRRSDDPATGSWVGRPAARQAR
jgi:diguanylate cyclase